MILRQSQKFTMTTRLCFFTPVVLSFLIFATNALSQSNTYVGDHGPFDVAYARNLVLDVPARPEPFIVQVTYPVDAERSPLVVFSHGFRCQWQGDDALVNHWARHGYTVVQPRHLDAEPDSKAEVYAQEIIWHERRRDMERSLNLIEKIMAAVPDLEGTLDLSTVIAAGHSYGGLTAQSAGGATTFSRGEPNQPVHEPDPRFKSVVAVSPPGHMPGFIDENSAKTIDRPMIVTTGTQDFVPPMMPTWEVHTDTYVGARPGEKYLAVIDGADHRFGGLICGDVGTEPMDEQLVTLNTATLAFMDYTARGSQTAKAYLDGLAGAGRTDAMYAFEMK